MTTEDLFRDLLRQGHTPAEILKLVDREEPLLLLQTNVNGKTLLTAPIEEQSSTVELKNIDGSTWKCVTAKEHSTLLTGKPISISLFTGPKAVVYRMSHIPPKG